MKISYVTALLSALVSLSACGPVKEVTCNGFKSNLLCTLIDGNTEQRIDNIEDEDVEQNARLRAIEKRIEQQEANLNYLLSLQPASSAALDALQAQVDANYEQLGQLAADVAGIAASQVSVIDPCPAVSSTQPKEMLLRIGGKTVAYFEAGGKRFLSELASGVQYRTTDARGCLFTL